LDTQQYSSCDSVVDIVTKLRAGRSKIRIRTGVNISVSSKMTKLALGPEQPFTQWMPDFFAGGKAGEK
jgi:hypothetical protein